ncbi:1-phosphofructokinase [[Mycoplasma] testudinis]|uniref:1-phosphofructokinase n=1 Tax=[Mycoplasma] testudinis TaxID=33924 RepID=UPI000566C84D|nr:1-phosphofructokinase family hexose kinase [[Mycoplasma] testudinis]
MNKFCTVTLSPSIDYRIHNETTLKLEGLNRISNYEFVPGGKGINAGVTLKRLNYEVKNFTFLGKDNASFFNNLVAKENLDVTAFLIDTPTRINIKYHDSKLDFEINGINPEIDKINFNKFKRELQSLDNTDTIFIMGRISEVYLKEILAIVVDKKMRFVLDIDSDKTLEYLKYKPFVFKPNLDEAQRVLKQELKDQKAIKQALIKLRHLGVDHPVISSGANGAYALIQNNQVIWVRAKAKINVVSTVGAGDSLISAYVAQLLKTNDVLESFKYANAVALSAISSPWLVDINKVQKMLGLLEIHLI